MKPRKRPVCVPKIVGCMLITLGLGIFIAYIIPYYFLIFLLGIGIMGFGISCLLHR